MYEVIVIAPVILTYGDSIFCIPTVSLGSWEFGIVDCVLTRTRTRHGFYLSFFSWLLERHDCETLECEMDVKHCTSSTQTRPKTWTILE